MTATMTQALDAPTLSAFTVLMTANADTQVIDVKHAKSLCMKTKGITADSVKLFYSLIPNAGVDDWTQVLDEFGVNPFTTNDAFQIEITNFSEIKIERVGATDGNITAQISLSTHQ
jgi:hypothetical protein